MDQYLIEDYGVVEDPSWLKSEDDIVDYFTDCGRDYLECGQGFFQDETTIIAKIGDKFYEITVKAEICSAKQDRGDRLYWVEDIKSVKYKEIDKPVQIEKEEMVTITKAEYDSLKDDARWLLCLQDAGVDNWSGYSYAQEMYSE